MGSLPQFFMTGGAARADFLDYLTKGAIEAGTKPNYPI
jgi:hypothetical protein